MRALTRRNLLVSASSVLAAPFVARIAQSATKPIRIGVLGDMTGPYQVFSGVNTIAATKLAIADLNKLHPDIAVDVVSADFQLKPDIGISITRQWFEEGGVDCIIDVPMSALALGLVNLCAQKDKVALFTGTATEDLTNKACGPNHVHWTYDSYSMATTVARALLAKKLDRWFFIAADYAMGASVVAMPVPRSPRPAARSSAPSDIPSLRPATFRAICCRPRPAAPTSSVSPMRARISRTVSSRPRSSTSRARAPSSPRC